MKRPYLFMLSNYFVAKLVSNLNFPRSESFFSELSRTEQIGPSGFYEIDWKRQLLDPGLLVD